MNTLSRPATIKSWVDQFLATGMEVEYLRDVWYYMKGDIQHIKFPHYSEKQWDEYVNQHIGTYIFELYLGGDFSIYDRLSIISTGLLEDNYENNTPMVIFTEKKTRTINTAADALRAAKYYSTGQIPHFECVNVAEYLMDNVGEDGAAYIIGLVDYDPSGDVIFNSLVGRVRSILEMHGDVELFSFQVEYGKSYSGIISKYKTFSLSTNPKNLPCQSWINSGRPHGVEFNNVFDRAEHLEQNILLNIDPEFVRQLSESRVRAVIYHDLLNEDDEYQEILIRKQEIEEMHQDTADNGEAVFTPIWGTPITQKSVRKMTVIKS